LFGSHGVVCWPVSPDVVYWIFDSCFREEILLSTGALRRRTQVRLSKQVVHLRKYNMIYEAKRVANIYLRWFQELI